MNNLFKAFQNALQSSLPIEVNHATVEVVTVCNQGFCCLGCDSVTQHHIPDEWKLQVPDALKDCIHLQGKSMKSGCAGRSGYIIYIQPTRLMTGQSVWQTNGMAMICNGQCLSVLVRMHTAGQQSGMNAMLHGDNQEKGGWEASNMRCKKTVDPGWMIMAGGIRMVKSKYNLEFC